MGTACTCSRVFKLRDWWASAILFKLCKPGHSVAKPAHYMYLHARGHEVLLLGQVPLRAWHLHHERRAGRVAPGKVVAVGGPGPTARLLLWRRMLEVVLLLVRLRRVRSRRRGRPHSGGAAAASCHTPGCTAAPLLLELLLRVLLRLLVGMRLLLLLCCGGSVVCCGRCRHVGHARHAAAVAAGVHATRGRRLKGVAYRRAWVATTGQLRKLQQPL